MSVSRRELAAMRSAGWEVQTHTFAERLRALLGQQQPVARVWATDETSAGRVPVERWSA